MKGAGRGADAALVTDGRFSGAPRLLRRPCRARGSRRRPIAFVADGDRIVHRRRARTLDLMSTTTNWPPRRTGSCPSPVHERRAAKFARLVTGAERARSRSRRRPLLENARRGRRNTMRQDRVSRWARHLLARRPRPAGGDVEPAPPGIVIALWCHVPALSSSGADEAQPHPHADGGGAVIVLATLALRSCFTACCGRAWPPSGSWSAPPWPCTSHAGNIEMHFHFFVVVGVITRTRSGSPSAGPRVRGAAPRRDGCRRPEFGVRPQSAIQDPWLWAAIHGAFVLAASVPHILACASTRTRPCATR